VFGRRPWREFLEFDADRDLEVRCSSPKEEAGLVAAVLKPAGRSSSDDGERQLELSPVARRVAKDTQNLARLICCAM
jgi:hypothetical protein